MNGKKLKISLVLFSSIFFLSSPVWAATSANATAKVAILPFNMHTPPQLHYLQAGVRDILAARLAWQGKVQVVDHNVIERALRGKRSDISQAEAVLIGKSVGADYVLYGSITTLGQSVNIDARIMPLNGSKQPVAMYLQSQNLNDVIPKINQFAQQINYSLFSVEQGQMATEQTQQQAVDSNANPNQLIPKNTQSTSQASQPKSKGSIFNDILTNWPKPKDTLRWPHS